MLSQKQRLSTADFNAVWDRGERIHTSFFSCIYRKQQGPLPQFAVAIPKKLATSAVERNTLRRKVYRAIHLTQKEKSLPYDLIILAKEKITTASVADIKQTLIEHL